VKKSDLVTVTSKNGRRRFIRAGSAFLLAGAAAKASAQENGGFIRADCDGVGSAEGKNAEAENSDSDSGASADRQGCGVKKRVPITYLGETKKLT